MQHTEKESGFEVQRKDLVSGTWLTVGEFPNLPEAEMAAAHDPGDGPTRVIEIKGVWY